MAWKKWKPPRLLTRVGIRAGPRAEHFGISAHAGPRFQGSQKAEPRARVLARQSLNRCAHMCYVGTPQTQHSTAHWKLLVEKCAGTLGTYKYIWKVSENHIKKIKIFILGQYFHLHLNVQYGFSLDLTFNKSKNNFLTFLQRVPP